VAIMDRAKSRNLEFSKIISIGNKMQIDETALLDYLAEDEATGVVSMYLENIKNGREFMNVARRVSEKKPVIILKSGKSEKAKKAILSHTGALAGSDDILEEVFRKTGVIRASDTDQFFALTAITSNRAFVARKNLGSVAVITNAGGLGVLTADAFEGKKIELAEIKEEVRKDLHSFLPSESSVENPIDLLGDAREDRYEKALLALDKDDSIGVVLCLLTPQDQTPVKKIAESIARVSKNSQKFIVTVFVGGEKIKESISYLRENGVVSLAFPELAVSALDKCYAWNVFRDTISSQSNDVKIDSKRKEKVEKIIAKVKKEKRTALSFSEASAVVGLYDIATPTVNNLTVDDDLPKIEKFPVVMKVDSDKVLHKTDKQGVILNIKNQEELQQAQAQMKVNFPGENLIIQEMLSIKTELIMGIKQDSIFGPIVVYGLGGIYTEVFKMVNFLVPPLDLAEIKNSLLQSKIKFLFEETRGQKAHNIDEMAQMLLGVSRLAQEISDIKELDINPVLIYNDGKSAVAVDVKIII